MTPHDSTLECIRDTVVNNMMETPVVGEEGAMAGLSMETPPGAVPVTDEEEEESEEESCSSGDDIEDVINSTIDEEEEEADAHAVVGGKRAFKESSVCEKKQKKGGKPSSVTDEERRAKRAEYARMRRVKRHASKEAAGEGRKRVRKSASGVEKKTVGESSKPAAVVKLVHKAKDTESVVVMSSASSSSASAAPKREALVEAQMKAMIQSCDRVDKALGEPAKNCSIILRCR